MAFRTTPYKITVYGVGDLGRIIVREATRLPEFEIVGALVFSEKKDNVDIGTLAGIAPIGVTATRDVAKFLAIECDAVIHLAVDAPHLDAQAQFVTLLEAGKNVVTSQPFSYLPSRDASFGKAIKIACEHGKTTFYAAGLNPDLATQRILPLLTGMSNDVTQINLEEFFDCQAQESRSTLEVIGLGQSMDQAVDENGPALWYQRHYNYQMIQHICHELGVDNVRLGGSVECHPAPHDIQRPVMTIPKGNCASISYTSTGFVDDKPFINIKITYYFSPAMKPPQLEADNVYIITIEGRPSSRTVLSLRPSYSTNKSQCDGEPAPPAYIAVANTILQSVPVTVEAPPGFRSTDISVIHWRKDQRRNVGKYYTEN